MTTGAVNNLKGIVCVFTAILKYCPANVNRSNCSLFRVSSYCNARRQYLLTLQVSRYCLLALQNSSLYRPKLFVKKYQDMSQYSSKYPDTVDSRTRRREQDHALLRTSTTQILYMVYYDLYVLRHNVLFFQNPRLR